MMAQPSIQMTEQKIAATIEKLMISMRSVIDDMSSSSVSVP
jgi:hypothetical protein